MRVVLFMAMFAGTFSFKFLVYSPIFGYSHQKFLGAIADSLTEAGHDVTLLMPVQDPQEKNKTGVKLTKKIIYIDEDEYIINAAEVMKYTIFKILWTMDPDPLTMMQHGANMSKIFQHSCKVVMQQKVLLEKLKNEKFDVGIAEPFSACGLGLFQVLGIEKTIAALSPTKVEPFSRFIGEPLAPSYVPALMSSNSPQMNVWQRIHNLFNVEMGAMFFSKIYYMEYEEIKAAYPDMKPLEELLGGVSIAFANSNPYLNYPAPTIHKVVDIGGITVDLKTTGKLDKELDNLLNERKHTIYISFGSVAKSKDMPEEWKNSLVEVFTRMPDVTFIWKYEEPTTITKHLKNVHLSKWLPQNDLLADKRLSLFVTHGGLGSTTEVAHQGKPAVMQPRNSHMLAQHGGAIALKKADLTHPDVLIETFRKILDDDSYAKNATRLAEVLKNRPISNKDLLVKHCEFVAKYGPLNQLDPYGRHLSIFQYFYIDALLLILTVLIVVIFVVVKALCFLKRKCFGSGKQKQE